MGRNKVTTAVDARLQAKAEADFRALPFSQESVRLKAIMAVGKGLTLRQIAEVNSITQNTIYRWVRDYKQYGLSGLQDSPKGHPKRRLNPEQETIVKEWIANQIDPDGKPIHWTLSLLKLFIAERLGVATSRTRLQKRMQEWGFKLKVPRPKHSQGDPQKQEEFKKKSGHPRRARKEKARK